MMTLHPQRPLWICLALLAGCSISGPSTSASGTTATSRPSPMPSTAPTLPASAIGTIPATQISQQAPPSTVAVGAGPCGLEPKPPSRYEHVIWIWMENKDATQIASSKKAPFLAGLPTSCGYASDFVDDGDHPSLPNYIKATSGDTQGIHDDNPPASHQLTVDNIFRQVRTAGGTAKSYEESMPGNCALTSTASYAVKHNPAAYYVGADDRTACQRDDVPFDSFAADLGGGLPAFSLITPDLCNDMHSCPIATGDQWLNNLVTAITASAVYRAGTTAVFIVFDESRGAGTTPFFAIAPSVVPGTRAAGELDLYSLLAFTEDALGIPTHLGRAGGANDLAAPFNL